jgi:hypothetical protein
MSKKPERRQFNVNMQSEADEALVTMFRAFVKAETRYSFPQAILLAVEEFMQRHRRPQPIEPQRSPQA